MPQLAGKQYIDHGKELVMEKTNITGSMRALNYLNVFYAAVMCSPVQLDSLQSNTFNTLSKRALPAMLDVKSPLMGEAMKFAEIGNYGVALASK